MLAYARLTQRRLALPGAGMSVMEMSHRGKEFQSIIDAAEADLRALLGVPDNYHVLFMQVGVGGRVGWGRRVGGRLWVRRRLPYGLGRAAAWELRPLLLRAAHARRTPPRARSPTAARRAAPPPSSPPSRSTWRPRARPWTTW